MELFTIPTLFEEFFNNNGEKQINPMVFIIVAFLFMVILIFKFIKTFKPLQLVIHIRINGVYK